MVCTGRYMLRIHYAVSDTDLRHRTHVLRESGTDLGQQVQASLSRTRAQTPPAGTSLPLWSYALSGTG
eukprot:2329028-Rhodomonas_salina.4